MTAVSSLEGEDKRGRMDSIEREQPMSARTDTGSKSCSVRHTFDSGGKMSVARAEDITKWSRLRVDSSSDDAAAELPST